MTGHNPTTNPNRTGHWIKEYTNPFCQGGCPWAYIAVLPPSKIREDFRRATITWRRLLTRQYRCLATVVEEVAVQSCHRSLATVKNLRRLLTHRHRHCRGGRAAKSKEIADALTLQSRHRCWGGFLIAVLLPSRIWREQQICGRNRQKPIQQTDFWHQQEGVTNKKLTERVRKEGVQMGRHYKQLTTINNREIGKDGNSGQVTPQNWLGLVGGREKRRRGISENKCGTVPCALCCYLIYSFSSSYNYTSALGFHVLHLQKKIVLHVCTCSLVGWGLSMLACSYYSLMRVDLRDCDR